MLYLLYLFASFTSFFLNPSINKNHNTSKVLLEVINHDSKNINGLYLEIYSDERLVARLNTLNITAITLEKEKYEFMLYYCNEVYKIQTEVIQQQHHMVFVIAEKKCKENLLLSK